ncbi:hypothetical protein BDR07DRAFT_1426283, partial [Suillus spraguei]
MHKGKASRNSTDLEATTRSPESKSLSIFNTVIGDIVDVHLYARMALSVLSCAAKIILAHNTAVFTGSSDKTVRLWDAGTREPVGEPLREHTSSVSSVSFSPDGTRVVTGSTFKEDVTVALFNNPHPISVSFIASHF